MDALYQLSYRGITLQIIANFRGDSKLAYAENQQGTYLRIGVLKVKTRAWRVFTLVQGAGFEPANSKEERFTVSCV